MKRTLCILLFPLFLISCSSNKKEITINPSIIKRGDTAKVVRDKMGSEPDVIKKNLIGKHFHTEIWVLKKKKGRLQYVKKATRGAARRFLGVDPIETWNDGIFLLRKKRPEIQRIKHIEVSYNKSGRVEEVLEKES